MSKVSGGVGNYDFSDNIGNRFLLVDLMYYRLKMIDNDAKYSYSPIRMVNLNAQLLTLNINIFPNPTHDLLTLTGNNM